MDVGSTAAVYPGPLDVKNEYLSTVLLQTDIGEVCSGVLMTADKILTAGHCVCAKRKVRASDKEKIKATIKQEFPKETAKHRDRFLNTIDMIQDSSDCLSDLLVLIVNHGDPENSVAKPYMATAVRPHPDFLFLVDARNKGVYVEADLAILQLSRAVKGENIRPIKVRNQEVVPKEDILLVGHGPGETHWPKKQWGFRHVGQSKVTTLERHASGSTRIAASSQEHDTRVFGGDSGGGGFLQKDDTVLVGIISTTSEKHGAILESIHPHLKWLEDEGLITLQTGHASPP